MALLFMVGFVATSIQNGDIPLLARVAVAVPLGLSTFVAASWLLLMGPARYAPNYAVAALAAFTAAVTVVRWRKLTRGRVLLVVTLGVAGVFAASIVFQALNLTRISSDSIAYLRISSLLRETGDLSSVYPPKDLFERQLFVPLMHVAANGSGSFLIPSITPLMGLSGLGAFAWFGNHLLRRSEVRRSTRAMLLGAAMMLLLSTDRVLYFMLYINSHITFATYLFLLVVGLYLMVEHDDTRWRVLIPLSMIPLLLSRPEAGLVVALAALPVLSRRSTSPGTRWLLTWTFVATIGLWVGIGIRPRLAGSEDAVRSGAEGILAVAALILLLTLATRIDRLGHMLEFIPQATIIGLVGLVGLMAMAKPELMAASFHAMRQNLILGEGHWALTWVAMTVSVTFAIAVGGLRGWSIWLTPVLGYVPLLLALSYLRGEAYRVATRDSANRMMMHVLFVALLYVISAVGSRSRGRLAPQDSSEAAL